MIKNHSSSRNWNGKLVENVQSNKSSAKHWIALNSRLHLRNSREHVDVGLYFNLTLCPAEQHLLQTPRRCLLRCFSSGEGRVCLEPASLCLTLSSFFSPPASFLRFCLKDGWLSQPTCPARLCRPARSA